MGFLKNIISNAIGEGISQGISKAVSSAAEKAIKPAAEKWAGETAKGINSAAEAMEQYNQETGADAAGEAPSIEEAFGNLAAASIYGTVLANFPKWTYTPIEEVSSSEEDEYVCVMVGMKLTDDLIEKYQEELKGAGFTGDWQIMGKTIGGKAHKVDFTFVSDGYFNYYIFK